MTSGQNGETKILSRPVSFFPPVAEKKIRRLISRSYLYIYYHLYIRVGAAYIFVQGFGNGSLHRNYKLSQFAYMHCRHSLHIWLYQRADGWSGLRPGIGAAYIYQEFVNGAACMVFGLGSVQTTYKKGFSHVHSAQATYESSWVTVLNRGVFKKCLQWLAKSSSKVLVQPTYRCGRPCQIGAAYIYRSNLFLES